MDVEQEVVAPEQAIEQLPGAVTDGNNADTTGAPAKVEETEQEKAEKIVAERRVREERARSKIQRRFSEMTAESREKDAIIRKLIEERSPAPQTQQRTDSDPQPKREDFDDWQEFARADARWNARQETKSALAAERKAWEAQLQQQQQAREVAQIEQTHVQRVAAYAKTNPEFAQVLESDVQIMGAAPVLLAMMEDGPAVMLALDKNPALADRLNNAAPAMQGVILGQISAALKQKAPQVSSAPAPGTPVGGKPTSTAARLENADYDDFVKIRRRQIAQRR